jgi:hypothetical protein
MGFVALLILDGGKHLLVTKGGGLSLMFNPFTSAFVGLVAGLFATKVYRLLAVIAVNITRRIEPSAVRVRQFKADKDREVAHCGKTHNDNAGM